MGRDCTWAGTIACSLHGEDREDTRLMRRMRRAGGPATRAAGRAAHELHSRPGRLAGITGRTGEMGTVHKINGAQMLRAGTGGPCAPKKAAATRATKKQKRLVPPKQQRAHGNRGDQPSSTSLRCGARVHVMVACLMSAPMPCLQGTQYPVHGSRHEIRHQAASWKIAAFSDASLVTRLAAVHKGSLAGHVKEHTSRE